MTNKNNNKATCFSKQLFHAFKIKALKKKITVYIHFLLVLESQMSFHLEKAHSLTDN